MTAPEFDDTFRNRFEDLIKWRRDVRRFRTDPVDPELIAHLLELAAHAPSVGLSQPWRFIPAEDEAARHAVVASYERCNAEALDGYDGDDRALYARLKLEGLREAPVQFAVFCDEATEKGKGLGVGWVSILDPDAVRKAVDAPSSWTLVAYLCVGYPQEEHDDPELERAGWERRDAAVMDTE